MSEDVQYGVHQEASLPFISVVIPVRNEFEGLQLLLPDLLSQDYPHARWEIIIADGGSTDTTSDLVRELAQLTSVPIRLVPNRGIRSGAGRNLGILLTKGDLVVFIDGHCRVRSRSLLSDTKEIFECEKIQCLCRPQPLSGSPRSALSLDIAEVRCSVLGHGRGSMIYDLAFVGFTDPRSSGATYRRTVFDEIGMYDETFDACEDVDLNVRVALRGMQGYSDPRLAVEYQARETIGALAKQMIRYGRGRVRLARKHPTERSLSSLAPLLLCLLIGALPFAWINRPILIIVALPVAFYLCTVIVATLHLIGKKRRPRLASALVIYPVIHLGLGLGMILEVLSACKDVLYGEAWRKRAVSR